MIDRYIPATAGMVFVFNSGSEMGHVMLLGVDIDRYRKMFPGSFKVTEGRLFKPGERGVLVSEEARKQGYEQMDFWLLPEGTDLNKTHLTKEARENRDNLDLRRDLVFMGASDSNSSMDIRVPVKVIITYKALNKIWGAYCIIDIESFREAHNYVTGADTEVKISKEQQNLLSGDNLDQLFASDNTVQNAPITSEAITVTDLKSELKKAGQKVDLDAGSYNVAFLKLKKGVSQQQALEELNRIFKQEKLAVRAVSWKAAVGSFGSMAEMIKGALNLFIMFIFFVAIIVIMNTLSMAALERTSEIGMMRAIGARKGFLWKMFIYETGVLSFCFGGLGIIAGIALIYLINAANITTPNEILQLVYGGDKLSPLFTVADLVTGIFYMAVVTLIAVVYPLRVVGKIVPLDAIGRE
jgi:putative ABC transport system permease protein